MIQIYINCLPLFLNKGLVDCLYVKIHTENDLKSNYIRVASLKILENLNERRSASYEIFSYHPVMKVFGVLLHRIRRPFEN